jgi:HNH endonuclease
MVRTDGRTKRRAHRVMREKYKGKITPGMVLHHKCQNRRCCNPDHLEMLSKSEHSALHRGNLIGRDGLLSHCRKGHEFTPENTYIRTGGARAAGSVQMSGSRTGRPGTRTSSKPRGFATKPDSRSRTSSQIWRPRMVFPLI